MAKEIPSTPRFKILPFMRQAIKEGTSRAAFFRELVSKGTTYQKSLMVSDWRSISEHIEKEGKLQDLRKEAHPTTRNIIKVDWHNLSTEYMYTIRTLSRISPDKPLEEHFVNILSDNLLTIRQIEREVKKRWADWQRPEGSPPLVEHELVSMQAWTAYQNIGE